MPALQVKRAIAFVDWHTAVIASGANIRSGRRPVVVAKATLQHVERIVSDYLGQIDAASRFLVRLRLYAGWYSGKTRTPYFAGVSKIVSTYASKMRTYKSGRVAFRGSHDGVQLGDRLACVPGRLARKQGVHLLDTLRHRNASMEEKMVDTALVVDLVGLAIRKEADRYLVVSDDDDAWPGVLAAEAAGANSVMLSRPKTHSKFMAHTRDLVYTYQSATT